MAPRTLEAPRRAPDIPIAGDGRFPGGGGGGEFSHQPAASPASIAVWLLVGSITILFAAFTSTYLARRGEADWTVGPLPAVLYLSTTLLLLSSAALEWARRRGRGGRLGALRGGLLAAAGLGVAFLALQVAAWRQLVAAGVYLSTNPHSSFFYLLTGAHALHLAGGLAAIGYALARSRRAPSAEVALGTVDPVATFWHFLDGLWLYLFAILFAL